MFWWLPRRRARIKRLDAEAEALICELGVDAYAEARRKEYEASSDIIAKDWGRVAVVVAKRTGLDVMHTGPRDADVALGNEPVAPSELRLNSEPSPLGPRRRNRSSPRMRLRQANSISTFFR